MRSCIGRQNSECTAGHRGGCGQQHLHRRYTQYPRAEVAMEWQPAHRRSLPQGKMRSVVVAITDVVIHQAFEMLLAHAVVLVLMLSA
jgi:hypothetical protein